MPRVSRTTSQEPVLSVRGFSVGTAAAGMKTRGGLDVCLIVSDRPCAAAGVFTRNRVVGEPVKLDRLHLRNATHRAIVANAKFSNVCTGRQGAADARAMARQVAELVGCSAREVFVASTGCIGAPLPMVKIVPAIISAYGARGAKKWSDGARSIMTTDTRPKRARRTAVVGGKRVTLAAIAKGSGMIHPNMATMLCFVATDAAIEKPLLQAVLSRVVERTFNCVTVDGDTSTSDSVLVLANCAAGNRPISRPGKDAAAFEAALESLCVELAREIARDGEGARHLVTIRVSGTRTDRAARRIAHTIGTSPLVKTAVYGRDANWGRIAAAAGRAGVAFRASELSLAMNGIRIFHQGEPVDDYDEAALTRTLDREEIVIDVSVGNGKGRATVWTCDFTDDYIRINADYRS
ncbi:bifunctional glutamate N-acetyltransferase/amino-acid acetyltransferase ArgJ [Candidatus Sumerlaeota bacterium]|nr:bifunctional glutamate N-acetyltransferase/amino-acid acetyltransferase ArgJ [Candidatus Sumerlaeota bacterium]